MNLIAVEWAGYWAGLGVELGVILIAGVLLVLILTGVLFKWIAAIGAAIERGKEERARKKAEREARAAAEAEARAAAEAEAEAAAAEAEAAAAEEAETEDEEVYAEEEEAEEVTEEELAAEEAAAAEAEEPEAEEEAEEEPEEEVKPKKKKKKKRGAEEDEAEEAEADEGQTEVVYVNEGVTFNESKTITELYEELSAEQKNYFDELREEALTKPDAELSMSRNFVAVKIGKRNLIKILIKRGVTVAEFMLENEQLKQLRLSSANKRGKSTIKVKPTVVQVLDLTSLKVAIDMINLAYEEIILD